MDRLNKSCRQFLEYPKNLVEHHVLEHSLAAYSARLNDPAKQMFVDDGEAVLDFLDFDTNSRDFQPTTMKDIVTLKKWLREAQKNPNGEPLCRFVSIHARHSLDPLSISHDMLCFLFSYLQVMPAFLDFMFPFGDQEYPQDCYFSGLREDSFLDSRQRGLSIDQLRRSGRETRLCYNLRSVERLERSPNQIDLPWSIRQAAVHHEFDLDSGRSVWVTVKGNKLIQDRLFNLSKSWESCKLDSLPDSFAATLAAHVLICDWSIENWRWYLNDLENRFQCLTRSTLINFVGRPPSPDIQSLTSPTMGPMSPQSLNGTFTFSSRAGTKPSLMSPGGRSTTLSTLSRAPTGGLPSFYQNDSAAANRSDVKMTWSRFSTIARRTFTKSMASAYRKLTSLQILKPHIDSDDLTEKTRPFAQPLGLQIGSQPTPPELREDDSLQPQEKFKFSRLQSIQYIEEKAQEALLVLRLNAEVLEELREHYRYTTGHAGFPSVITASCGTEIARFEKRVRGVEKDLKMQRSRTETLIGLLGERKQILYGILQYQSMQASENFAKKAQESANTMTAMTVDMHEIAQKTKQETVSMRIITLVTLFFLPGMFIGVGAFVVSALKATDKNIETLMSTDIFTFEADNVQHFQIQGLKLYLEICIPMMVVTFLAWYLVYKSVDKSGKRVKEVAANEYSNRV